MNSLLKKSGIVSIYACSRAFGNGFFEIRITTAISCLNIDNNITSRVHYITEKYDEAQEVPKDDTEKCEQKLKFTSLTPH